MAARAETGAGTREAEASKPDTSAPQPAEPDSVPLVEGMAPLWPDDAAESAFRAEARERGETVVASPPAADDGREDAEAGALPPLDQLVARLPADVRETLDDLFRARFVAVRRVPRKALKT